MSPRPSCDFSSSGDHFHPAALRISSRALGAQSDLGRSHIATWIARRHSTEHADDGEHTDLRALEQLVVHVVHFDLPRFFGALGREPSVERSASACGATEAMQAG